MTAIVTKKRVSIKDIAEAAGVSHPTVSRALRGEGRMSESTRERIVALAHELGYTPSMVARGLVTQRSYSIGLTVTTFADAFYSELTQGVEDEAMRHDYSIFLASTAVDPRREMEVVQRFQGRQVDGIIVASSRVGDRYADLLAETGIPIVLVNTHADGDNMHTVYHDDDSGCCALVRHLLAQGCRRIAYLGNDRAGKAQSDRRRAWRKTLLDAGHEPVVEATGPHGRFDGGVTALPILLERAERCWGEAPDGIVCYNDTMAIGALSVLRARGLRTPEDVRVTGFDDVDVAAYVHPALTTWRQPRHRMGVLAMRMMLGLLTEGAADGPPRTEMVCGQLVVRESA